MACGRFLKFDLDSPPWRKNNEDNSLPSISRMLKDILACKNKWEDIQKSQNSELQNKIKLVRQEIFCEFLYRVQEGQKIGVEDRKTFEEVVSDFDISETEGHIRENSEFNSDNKDTILKLEKPDSQSSEEKLRESNIIDADIKSEQNNIPERTILETGSSLESNADSDTKSTKSDTQISQCSVESLPDSNIIEDISEHNKMTERKKLETINLYKGYRFLQKDFKLIPRTERKDFLGWIDVQHSIKDCHEVLLQGLIDTSKTGPGIFSTKERYVDFEGKTYVYLHFATEEIASAAVQAIVDQYHMMLEEIKVVNNPIEQLTNSFKCASVLLFSFLALHPFSDGNGRLGRLLCDRCLSTFCPVPTPIYNVYSPSIRDDYLQALVKGRTNLKSGIEIKSEAEAVKQAITIMEQQPTDLCSLIIECNWCMWKEFFHKIGEKSIQFSTSDNNTN